MPLVDVEEPPAEAEARAPELHHLISSLERAMQVRVAQELGRVEASVERLFADLEARLVAAQAEADRLREENATLTRENERYQRAFETLREMWQEER